MRVIEVIEKIKLLILFVIIGFFLLIIDLLFLKISMIFLELDL